MEKQHATPGKYVLIVCWALILAGLCLTSLYNYLLFHSLAEIFSMVVACGIFMVAINSRQFLENNYLLFLGIAYLYVAGMDFVHTLAYKGMGVFPGADTNVPTQLWIAARYMESTSLLIAPLFLARRLKIRMVISGFTVIIGLMLASIFYWDVFPVCFVEGVGLTPFKKGSEYIIILILLTAVLFLIRNRKAFDREVLQWLVASLIATMGSELALTFYVHAYGVSNLIGHVLKIISFYLIYRAIIQTGLVKPYNFLFRDLKQSEERLRKARDDLERTVKERTAELVRSNELLRTEIVERKHAEEALMRSEDQKKAILDASVDRIRLVDLDLRIIWANKTSTRELDRLPEDMVGHTCYSLLMRRDTPCPGCPAVKALRSGRIEHAVMHQPRSTGIAGETYWDSYAVPIKNESGDIVNVIEITRNITERKRAEEKLQKSEEKLRFLSTKLLHAQEEERKRIALELHDTITQNLAAIKFGLESKLSQMESKPPPPGVSIETLIATAQSSIEEIRRVINNLRPSMLDDLGIVATISWWCREFEIIHPGIHIEKRVDIGEKEIPDSLKIVIYRVLQEALSNTVKHSGADLVRLRLRKNHGTVEMKINDNGQGFDPQSALSGDNPLKGLGLGSMKERTELSGGSFVLESRQGSGTTVRASWPCG